MSKNLNSENNSLSDESIKAVMEQANDVIKKATVPSQTAEEPTVQTSEQVSEENGDDTENTSKLVELKTKAMGLIKNKKFLIGTGAVVALGVIVKIALGSSTDEEEPVEDADENDESETSEV